MLLTMYTGYGLQLIALFQSTRWSDALKQGDENVPLFRRDRDAAEPAAPSERRKHRK